MWDPLWALLELRRHPRKNSHSHDKRRRVGLRRKGRAKVSSFRRAGGTLGSQESVLTHGVLLLIGD